MASNLMVVSADPRLIRDLEAALRESPAKIVSECSRAVDAQNQLAAAGGVIGLVVLDLFVPDSSGLDLLKTLRKVDEKCCFLLMARMRTRSIIERAFRLGAHDVLEFPVSGEILRDTILHRLALQPVEEEPEDEGKPQGKNSRRS